MEKIKFIDPESGKEIEGEMIRSRWISDSVVGEWDPLCCAEHRWLDVRVEGVAWAVPEGWPNNASPICEESEPEAYHAIF